MPAQAVGDGEHQLRRAVADVALDNEILTEAAHG